MKETKVYIVEDMAVSRMALENLLLDNDFEVCGSAASAEKALRQILEQPVDLVLVDIHLAFIWPELKMAFGWFTSFENV